MSRSVAPSFLRLVRHVMVALTCVAALATAAHAVTPRVHAIRGARIVTGPGQVIPRGNVIMRDGVIVAVGANVVVPAGAQTVDVAGKTIIPGLVDAHAALERQARVQLPAVHEPRAAAQERAVVAEAHGAVVGAAGDLLSRLLDARDPHTGKGLGEAIGNFKKAQRDAERDIARGNEIDATPQPDRLEKDASPRS